MAERIAVIGISGSGKSTFARTLGAKLDLPVHHGDDLDWLPNWGVRPEPELNAIHDSWLSGPRWIIEGWIDKGRIARLNAADLVIDLDFSPLLCGWRVLQRQVRGVRREEMPPGCIDRFDPRTLVWVFGRMERPSISTAIGMASLKRYVRLESPRDARAWLDALKPSARS